MIERKQIQKLVDSYDKDNITIGVLGGHSGLDVCRGSKKLGFRTIAVCQKGREKTYTKYYKTRGDGKGCVDETIVLDKFSDITKPKVQEQLRKGNTIFVPIYGTRSMLKLEERDVPKNQYYLLEKAGIRLPKIFKSPKDIDRLVIVKVSEAIRGYERAFFYASNYDDYKKKSNEMLTKKMIKKESLEKAVIEEYVIGAQINFNYFYSVIDDELEIMGTDTRRQTNLDGLIRLPANEQLEVLKYMKPKIIETGHIAATTKESIIEKIFTLGEKFVKTTKKEYPPGIIGPFALQGAIAADKGKEEMVVFDVSMRIPGSPLTRFTPTFYVFLNDQLRNRKLVLEQPYKSMKSLSRPTRANNKEAHILLLLLLSRPYYHNILTDYPGHHTHIETESVRNLDTSGLYYLLKELIQKSKLQLLKLLLLKRVFSNLFSSNPKSSFAHINIFGSYFLKGIWTKYSSFFSYNFIYIYIMFFCRNGINDLKFKR
jgi:5-formaminoimidazole-4-carboxamide-1-(beta)-D-ribofuranosyl 5'-monophosphate synthetase